MELGGKRMKRGRFIGPHGQFINKRGSPRFTWGDPLLVLVLSLICHGRGLNCACLNHYLAQLFGVNGFVQAQGAGNAIQCDAMFDQEADGTIVGIFDNSIYFFVDDCGGFLAVFTLTTGQSCARKWIITLTEGNGAEPFAHTPAADHLARDAGDAL